MSLRLHISEQGHFYEQRNQLPLADGDAITVHGSACKCVSGESLATFLAYSQATIESQLSNYFTSRGYNPATESRIVILDMEEPNDGVTTFVHPNNFWNHSPSDQVLIAQAWKMRIAAARAVLPKARLAMYGTLSPDPQGRADNATYLSRLAALRDVAGTQVGMYDQLDFLSPLLYPRFGPDDGSKWYAGEAYVQLGIAGSRQLAAGKPLLPLFTMRVANGNSLHQDQQVIDYDPPLERSLLLPFDICAQAGVKEAVFWVGVPVDDVLPDPNVNGWTVTDYIRRINMATTFKLIRDKQTSVIEAKVPTLLAGQGRFVSWQRHEGVAGGFLAWAASCAEPFRRFHILHGRDFEDEKYLDRDTDFHVHTEEVLVAYPNQEDLWGERLDDIIDQDLADINKAIGRRGYADYDALGTGLHKCHLVDRQDEERGAARILRARFRLEYDRSM